MRRILIVDDSAFSRGIHRRLLEGAGFDAVEADSIASARAVLRAEPFDGLLVDLLMPGGDGMGLVRELQGALPELRIIVCSADRQRARQQEAADLGVPLVSKPLDAAKLRAALEACGLREPDDA